MDASALYDTDFVRWTEQQAAALRRLAGTSNSLDIEHLAEEIESSGKRDVREVASNLRLILVHVLKIISCPTSSYRAHWQCEILAFQHDAVAAFAPSMRQLIALDDEWLPAVRAIAVEHPKLLQSRMLARAKLQGCPIGLDDLLRREFDLDAVLECCSFSLVDFGIVTAST